MNRNQAGLLAIGVLFVAIAIVLVGGIFDRGEEPAPRQVSATTTEPAAPANDKAAEPDKAARGAPADATAGAKDAKAPPPSSTAPEPGKTDAATPNPSTAETKPDQKPDADRTASRQPVAPASPPPVSDGAADRTAKPLIPAFDVLRVEPDGSTVIAGHASPGSTVKIMNGDKIVTETAADEQGDFVAVLDQPLAPGDYELKLKAQAKDGKAVESEEVATVSVPADTNGDLLAMVTKPGEASRIITAPKPAASSAAVKDAAKAPAAADAPAETGGDVVTTEADRGDRPAATSDAGSSQVRVDAVEIEGDSVYVAGAAPAGSMVRVYADDKLVGEAEATTEGRFVVDAKIPLAVGDHSIRADLVDPVTGQVVVRATVPFTRPAGDQFAAVAPAVDTEAKTAPTTANGGPSPDVAKLQSDAEAALSDLKAKTESATPSADEIEQARDKAARSLQALANGPQAAPDAPTGKADEGVRRKAGSALALLDTLPRFAKGQLPDVATMKAMRSKLPDVEKSLRGKEEDATPPPVTEAAVDANQPKTVVQPALTSSDEFVIIRRGDTLWQIARRAYGRGVRYTTIYLANSDQISDPDLILPGQIFDVPQKALKNSEELHRERLREEKHSAH